MATENAEIIPEREGPPSRSKRRQRKDAGTSSSSKAVLWLISLILLLSLVASGYLYLELEKAQQHRTKQGARITEIESKLSITDESLSQSDASIQSILTQHRGAIVDIRNSVEKNLPNSIAATKKAMQSQERQFTNSLEALRKGFKQELDQASSKLDKQVKGLNDSLASVTDDSLANTVNIQTLEKQVRELIDQNNRTLKTLEAQKALFALTDEQLASINESRLELNRRLLSMQSQLEALAKARNNSSEEANPNDINP